MQMPSQEEFVQMTAGSNGHYLNGHDSTPGQWDDDDEDYFITLFDLHVFEIKYSVLFLGWVSTRALTYLVAFRWLVILPAI